MLPLQIWIFWGNLQSLATQLEAYIKNQKNENYEIIFYQKLKPSLNRCIHFALNV